jgi:hypothetical protein
MGFKKRRAQAARGSIDGYAKTGRPATNDNDVPLALVFQSSQELLPIHGES